MRTWIQRQIETRPTAILVTFLLLAGLAASFASRVTIDGSVDRLLVQDDPARALDARAKLDFGNDEIIMVGFELPAPYEAADLQRLATLSEAVSELDHVRRVRDLATTEDIRGDGDFLDAGPLVDLDRIEADFEAIRVRAAGHPLYEDLLVSDDGRALGMMIYVDSVESNDATTNALTAEVMALMRERAGDWQVHFAGYPVTAYEVNRIVKRDLAVLTPLALLAIALVLVLTTRSLVPVGLFVALVVWVELAALAWLGLSGTPINVVISTLPTILIATTGTYVVYAVSLLAQVPNGSARGAGLIQLLWKPVLLSASSTAIGFGALSLIGMQSAGELGAALAVGIVAAAVGILVLFPAMIVRFGVRTTPRPVPGFDTIAQLGVRAAAKPALVALATAGVFLATIPGLGTLELHTDTLQYFSEDSAVRTGADFFQENLSSAFLLNVVVRSEEPNRALDDDVLAFTADLADRIEGLPNVDRTISMLDYFGLMDGAMRPGEAPRRNPGGRDITSQYLLLYESSGDPGDYERYLDFERSALSLIVSIHGGSTVYLDAAAMIDDFARRAPEGITVDTLGTTFLYSKAMEDLTEGMLEGLVVASLLIFVVLAIGLGSFSTALLATIPNLLPIVVCGGALGGLGVPISMSTSLMGCIALGLAVDDTSHVVGHLSPHVSLERLYAMVGPPILLTTVALCAGFGVLLASDFATVSVLGASVIATLLLALAADLLVLPSLLTGIGMARTETERIERIPPLEKHETLSGPLETSGAR